MWNASLMPVWWNGIHDALRTHCRKDCRFDSCHWYLLQIAISFKCTQGRSLCEKYSVIGSTASVEGGSIGSNPIASSWSFGRDGNALV